MKIIVVIYCNAYNLTVSTLWERIQTRILSNYDIAAHCYYEFLKLDETDTGLHILFHFILNFLTYLSRINKCTTYCSYA